MPELLAAFKKGGGQGGGGIECGVGEGVEDFRGENGKPPSETWFDPQEEFDFLGGDRFFNVEEDEALDVIRVELAEELKGSKRMGGGGGGGGGGVGGGVKLFALLEEDGAVKDGIEVWFGVTDGFGEFIKEGAKQCSLFGTFVDIFSATLSQRLLAEAFERRKLDELESPKEWKDSSSEE